ncbi:hypothetical protein SRB5_69930 [Streptomyces sp. RB5]|uniref:DUF3017 domain-containing protein n=1 Tax=Streptomyces smaragdinus TaxID=2585196 RepID=A0A7K0CTK7_9ACTN|nr:DUF3017 domain-containing protein [Streptomyces smaragdinus]MQY16790.1 hypothetical protein [Streptomyces smaragdinus]
MNDASSGRHPDVTVDTATPEGGRRLADGTAPAPARQWPILLVLGVAAIGLGIVAADHFRVGCLVLAGAILLGGVLRGTLPRVGMLAVRTRFTDIVTYAVLGVSIALLALAAQPDGIEIPFLTSILHSTL